MPDRIAIKRLTASDLTFFESLFRKLGAGNQKAINLNADVFIDRLYPALPSLVATYGDVIPVSMTILGPAAAAKLVLSRAVTKREAYKNWRLNGEFVRDPEGEPGRFDSLAAGDIAVLDFSGDPVPTRLTLLLLAANSPLDKALHDALDAFVSGGRRTMVEISRDALANAAGTTSSTHPIWQIAADREYEAAVEDAALGGIEGASTLTIKKAARPVSAATLAAAKASAEKNGRDGEALAWIQLQKLVADGSIAAAEWSARTNAVAPFDFLVTEVGGNVVHVDAKSTAGEFERRIHISFAELTAASSGPRYDIWRVHGIDDDGAKLRIARDIAPLAQAILTGLDLPVGVAIDGVSIDPTTLTWGVDVVIERPDEPVE
ncbi:hypothetical protein EYW49_22660 [Siculibacillus lacustris]|uniref:DUF3883 domain-containing protein n=1 Tax=Siculibacillus lacustris TaxID=1549641 RepID=A0A4Q9VC06_9HYPH|nr:hypothetical protein [Siculibacillus lacustris]TBW31961.1 hypothetical protein EYW49_22660 [Siculibacillus lacustris]